MTTLLAASCLSAVAALAACGGSSAAPAASAATTVAPTSVAAPTSTAAPTTSAPPTSAAPTTTTLDSMAKVIADFKATVNAYNGCLQSPATCDVSEIAIPASDSFHNLSEFFAKLARNGLLGRPSPRDRIVVESVDFSSNLSQATVKTCMFDAGVIYDARGNDDPSDDVMVDDGAGSAETIWTMSVADGVWRRAAAHVLRDEEGVDTCGTSAG
jgi:hypothetical protein